MRACPLPLLKPRPALLVLFFVVVTTSIGTWLFSQSKGGLGLPFDLDATLKKWGKGRGGSGLGQEKETAASWLHLYDALVQDLQATESNQTQQSIFCTPAIEEGHIQVSLNGRDVHHLESLEALSPHTLTIHASCPALNPGLGDFYESLLETPHYRSRAKFVHPSDGSGRFVGEPLVLPSEVVGQKLRLRVWRLYRAYEGILVDHEIKGEFDRGPGPFTRELIVDTEVAVTQSRAGDAAKPRPPCGTRDFDRVSWTGGYWYRPDLTDESWTFELPHCRVRRFSQEEASECMNGRWIGFLGDSTAQDMMRNTLWTFLGDSFPFPTNRPLPNDFTRSMDVNLTHPGHPERWTRMSMAFNGHYWVDGNRLGMNSFRHQAQIDRHDKYFEANAGVDTFIINSGLHDAWNRPTPQAFLEEFRFGWEYYMSKLEQLWEGQAPKVVYRFSVTPPVHLDGYTTVTPMNPASLEMINLLEADYLQSWSSMQQDIGLTFLDSYELTWSWHFDSQTNEGPHYGRAPWQAPGKTKFVDDIMVRIFLNDICS